MNGDILEEDFEKLRHMVGACYAKAKRGRRNSYVAADVDIPSMERLVTHGMVILVRGVNPELTGGAPLYRATKKGCLAAGLHKAAIARAMEVR